MSIFYKIVIAVLSAGLMSVSCSTDGGGKDEQCPQIILDSDIGSSYDDLIALAMLHTYERQGKCRLAGMVVDRMGEDCALTADVVNTWYDRPDLPLALVRDGIPDPAVWIDYRDMAEYRDAEGNRLFRNSGRKMSGIPDGYELYRQLLSRADDNSVEICCIGFLTALSQLLESGPDEYSELSGVELVRRKVRCLYVTGGGFDGTQEPDYNFAQGLSFTRTFFNLWPEDVDVILSPTEVGQRIDYTPLQVQEDYPAGHPFHEMLRHCKADEGQRMWDPLVVINAVEGDGLFRISERGRVILGEDAGTSFETDPQGNFRYHIPGDDKWNERMLDLIRRVSTSLHPCPAPLSQQYRGIRGTRKSSMNGSSGSAASPNTTPSGDRLQQRNQPESNLQDDVLHPSFHGEYGR